MARKSTTENPAEQTNAAEDDQISPPEPLDEETASLAGIERASVVNATHVMYVGMAHVREISTADWKQAGVNDQKKVVWDNRYRGKNIVPITELSAGALEYLDAIDAGFVLVDENGKRV
jgi:hypothetical protein